jgi:MFS family permease
MTPDERGADEESAPGPRNTARGPLTVVSISHAVQHVYLAGLVVAYPFVVATFHVSYAMLGLFLGVVGIIGGLLQALAGALRRLTARVLLSAQDFGLAASVLVCALAPVFWLFGAGLVVGSFVSWPQHPVGSSVLAEHYPHRRAYALSWHVAGGSIGTALIPIVSAALIAAYGWRVAVGVIAVPLAIGGLLIAWRLRVTAIPASAQAPGTVPRGIRALLRRREVMGALIAGTVAAGGRGLGTLSVFVPAYLRSGLHFAPLTIGVLFTILLVGSIGGPILAGHVADRVGRRRVLLVVYVLGAAAIATFVSVGRGVVVLGVVGFLVGVLAYSESPLLQSVFSEALTNAEQRAAFGYYFAISYGVGSLWTIGLGYMITHVGFHWAFFVMAFSFVGAAFVLFWFRPGTQLRRNVPIDSSTGAAHLSRSQADGRFRSTPER